jgi:hypothetical protein
MLNQRKMARVLNFGKNGILQSPIWCPWIHADCPHLSRVSSVAQVKTGDYQAAGGKQ